MDWPAKSVIASAVRGFESHSFLLSDVRGPCGLYGLGNLPPWYKGITLSRYDRELGSIPEGGLTQQLNMV